MYFKSLEDLIPRTKHFTLRSLLFQVGDEGKSGPAAEHNWSDTASEEQPDSPARSRQTDHDHEYHEISDEEEEPIPKVS